MKDLVQQLRDAAHEVNEIIWGRVNPRMRIPADTEDTDLRIARVLDEAASALERQAERSFEAGACEALGWTWAEVCHRLENGENIQTVEIPEVMERMAKDLGLKP